MDHKEINKAKYEIELRFKSLGWNNRELFTAWKPTNFSLEVSYFTGAHQKHRNFSKINWNVKTGAKYEKWFFEVIEDIMDKYNLKTTDFIFNL